ncbi:hypothetical protein GCM10009637_13980 [Brevibacterium luteolum]
MAYASPEGQPFWEKAVDVSTVALKDFNNFMHFQAQRYVILTIARAQHRGLLDFRHRINGSSDIRWG